MDEETGEITEEEMEEEGQEAVVPEAVELSPEVRQAEQPEIKEESSDDLADLFEVPQPEDNDMATGYLVEKPGDDDISDLVEVT